MGPIKKIVLAIPLDKDLQRNMEKIRNFKFEGDPQYHLVYIHHLQVFSDGFNSYSYPGPEEREKISKNFEAHLQKIGQNIFKQSESFLTKCLFGHNPKKEMVQYLKETGADLVVTATRKKGGLGDFFMSSFTDYLMKFAPCEVLVLRFHTPA